MCALIYIGFGKINKRIRQLQKLVIFASLFHLPAVINVPEIIFFLVCKSVVRSTNIDSFLKKNFVLQVRCANVAGTGEPRGRTEEIR